MPVGDRIKALRSEAGLSQAELAETIGGDGRQISRYETGSSTPSLDHLNPLLTRIRLRTITHRNRPQD